MSRVVIDIDGVLAEWNASFRELLIAHGATMRPFEDGQAPTVWEWPQKYGATYQQTQEAWRYVTEHPEWWGKLAPHEDMTPVAWKDLLWLMWHHDVVFATARPAAVRRATHQWLQVCIGRVSSGMAKPEDFTLIVLDNKIPLFQALDPDVIIEDKFSTLAQFEVHRRVHVQSILVTRPYNAMESWGNRAESTGEALAIARLTLGDK